MKPTENLLNAGLELMLAGMGTVFVFLTLLVAATMAMSAIVQRLLVPATLPDTDPSPEELAAISAAIHQHRATHNKT